MACRYRVIIEKTTYSIPGLVLGAEDCTPDTSCCTDPLTDIGVCDEDELSVAYLDDTNICSPDWELGAQTDFDTVVDVDVQSKTITLPPGSYEVSTECQTIECGDTDAECPCG